MNENMPAGELTFQKIFSTLKRSFVRIIIYAVIAAILGGGISAIALFASRGAAEYTAVVEYGFSEAENGKDPLGNMLDANRIKSSYNVNQALIAMGITDSAQLADYNAALSDALSVTGYVSPKIAAELKNDETMTYYSTRFIVNLTEDKSLSFKANQYQQFLNELLKSYRESFKQDYDFGSIITLDVADNALALSNDYIDLCTTYSLAIAKMQTQLEMIKDSLSERYSRINSNIAILSNELAAIENYILSNNVVKTTAPITIAENLAAKKTNYINLGALYKGRADELKTILDDYVHGASQITTDNGVVKIDITQSKEYDNYIKQYNALRSSQFSYAYEEAQIEIKEGVLKPVLCTDEQRAQVVARFTSFDSRIDNTVESANAELTQYSEQFITADGVKIAMPATRTQSVNSIVIVLVAFVCAVAASIAAVAVTNMQQKKGNTNNKEIEAESITE